MRPFACTRPFAVKASLTGSSLSFFATASASLVPAAFTAFRYCSVAEYVPAWTMFGIRPVRLK